MFLQPGIEHLQNISSPSDAQWKNAKPFKNIPGPRGPPYIGQLYHYKWAGKPHEPPHAYIAQTIYKIIMNVK